MAWPAVAADLLDGPRGRRLCFEVVSPARQLSTLDLHPFPGWLAMLSGREPDSAERLARELASIVALADLQAVASAADQPGLLEPLADPQGLGPGRRRASSSYMTP